MNNNLHKFKSISKVQKAYRSTYKSKVYDPKPTNVQQLRENIEREVKEFAKTDLKSIFLELKNRLDLIEQEKGKHIEYLL